jgi:hypothetical protein
VRRFTWAVLVRHMAKVKDSIDVDITVVEKQDIEN